MFEWSLMLRKLFGAPPCLFSSEHAFRFRRKRPNVRLQPRATIKPNLEVLIDRILPSATALGSFPAVAAASPPAAASGAVLTSYVDTTMKQLTQLTATLEQDVGGILQTLDQALAQELSHVMQQLDRILGITPTAVPLSGSGAGSGAMTTGHNVSNQPINNPTQQIGHGSVSSSTATPPIASGHGFAKMHSLASGSGSGSGTPATISGEVWLDNNGDGSIDNGEVGFQGITVDLWSNGSLVDSQVTDANGDFNFSELIQTSTPFQIQVLIPSGDYATFEGTDSDIDASGFTAVNYVPPGGAWNNILAGLRSMNVTTNQDDPNGAIPNKITLRDAIETGNNGPPAPTITFSPSAAGTIALQKTLDNIKKSYDIQGLGSDQLTVQGNANAGNQYSIFTINTGVTTQISGLTIEGGFSGFGGGIFNNGQLSLVGDVITDNTATSNGGGIDNASPAAGLGLQDDTIQFNTAESGGGIYNDGSLDSSTPDGVNIIANTATADGGGIYNLSKVELGGTTISGNTANSASGDGGGVYNGSDATFTLNEGFIGNNDAFDGGGLFNQGTATLETGVQVKDNTAKNQGGGLCLMTNSVTTLDNVTVTGNKASGAGGGLTIANGVGYYTPNTMNISALTDNDDPGGKPIKLG